MRFSVTCHSCAAVFETDDPVGRSARCERCGLDLRCCLTCRFHDESSYNACAEPMAERVVEKQKANFCDYYSPAARGAGAPSAPAGTSDKLSDLEKLFRK